MNSKSVPRLLFMLCGLTFSGAAKILAIVPTPSYSHQTSFQLLWKELSQRGHQLTVLTTHPMNDSTLTNLTEINLDFVIERREKKYNVTHLYELAHSKSLKSLPIFREMVKHDVEEELQHPEVQELIHNKNRHFDLVISEIRYPAMFAFAELFNCPLILITSYEAATSDYYLLGNPSHPLLHPDVMFPIFAPFSLWEKIIATLLLIHREYFLKTTVLPEETVLIRKCFGNQFASLAKISKRISMLYVSTDLVFSAIRPLLPVVVSISGGNHIRPPAELPPNIKEILDNGTEGVIYFSMGTTLTRDNLRQSTRRIILEAFAELPYQVLWKFDAKDLPRKPSNVFISKWLPQQDILRHPNTKLFVTQGGWQSLQESIHSHVPIVGLPFFTDQPSNINKMVTEGIGLYLDIDTMTKDAFKNVVLEVIENSKYRTRVKELATLAQDQPMTGLERAIWWTEYILKHKGAEHLRSPALNLPYYQYFLLDVIGFCLIAMSVAIYFVVVSVKFTCKLLLHFHCRLKQII